MVLSIAATSPLRKTDAFRGMLDVESEPGKRIAARQLKSSILSYMASDAFAPSVTMDDALGQSLFKAAAADLKPELPRSDDPRKLGIVPGFNDGK